MNLNMVQVCGRLTKQPELRTIPSGQTVLSISVATNRVYKNQAGEKVEETEFHNVTAWGKTAETIAKWFGKGDEIYIQGHLKTSDWEVDGVKKYRTDIIAERFEFGQKSKANQGNDHSQPEAGGDHSQPAEAEEEIQVENIPF